MRISHALAHVRLTATQRRINSIILTVVVSTSQMSRKRLRKFRHLLKVLRPATRVAGLRYKPADVAGSKSSSQTLRHSDSPAHHHFRRGQKTSSSPMPTARGWAIRLVGRPQGLSWISHQRKQQPHSLCASYLLHKEVPSQKKKQVLPPTCAHLPLLGTLVGVV